MRSLINNLIWIENWTLQTAIVVIMIDATILLASYVCKFFWVKHRKSMYKSILVEEITLCIMVSIILYVFFDMHISLIIYVVFVLLYMHCEKSNRIVKYHVRYPNKKYNSLQFEHMLKNCNEKGICGKMRAIKKEVCQGTPKQFLIDEQWKTTRLSSRVYLCGLLPLPVIRVFFGSSYYETRFFSIYLFDNVIFMSGIMYWGYLLFYFLDVKVITGDFVGDRKFFHVMCFLIYILALYVTLVISESMFRT